MCSMLSLILFDVDILRIHSWKSKTARAPPFDLSYRDTGPEHMHICRDPFDSHIHTISSYAADERQSDSTFEAP